MGLPTSKLYSTLPPFFQNIAISMYGYYWMNRRFGGIFSSEVQKFRSRQSFTCDQWLNYQTLELRKLLLHAFHTVPFYNKAYTSAGFSSSDFIHFKLADLKYLPYLEKEDLRKYGRSSLLSSYKDRFGNFYSSSGSTGTPTSIFYSGSFHQRWSAAFETRIREWAGVNRFMPRGMIGGRRVVSKAVAKPPFYRYNVFEKQTYFSAYHISSKTVHNYLQGIKQGNIQYMTGYAMSNYLLALEIEKAGLQAPKLKAVITSSEKLTPTMRDTFRRVYQCESYDSYSGVEACNLISETSDRYLVNSPDVGILEVLDEYGDSVNPGVSGEAVCTGLLNYDQPLIRYRIGDRITLGEFGASHHNIHMPVIQQIDGRIEDVVVGSDGRLMVRFHSVFVDLPGLIASQLVQKSTENILLRLVTSSTYSPTYSEPIMSSRIMSQLGPDTVIEFEYCNELPRTSSGKIQAVISLIK